MFRDLCFIPVHFFRGVSTKLDSYPDLVFHMVLSVLFGMMALTTVRMKFLWLPHMCIVAAGTLCQQDVWKAVLTAIRVPKPLVSVILIILLIQGSTRRCGW